MKKSVIPKWLSVLNILLLVAGIVLDVYLTSTVLKGDKTAMITSIALACACCFGLLYSVYGYQKEVATYATWFYGVFAIAIASKFFFLKANSENVHDVVLLATIVELVCLSVFAIARDLGKEKSMKLAVATLIAAIACPASFFILGEFTYAMIGSTEIVLSFVLLIMMSAKYKDKEARGAK